MTRSRHDNLLFRLSVATAVVMTMAGSAVARTITIELRKNDVQAHRPSDETLGNYYTFIVPVPDKLPQETFMDAFLELYVDGASEVDEAARGGVLTLEVFPLKSAITEEVTPSNLRPGSMKHTIRTGESQHVRINISEHVRYLLEHPGENYGLVVGSLTGQRLGKFTLRHDGFGPGIGARVTFVFAELGDKFVPRP